jgi:mannose-6-phosphate isomerase-like protein (cupin superfamily)
LAERGWSAARLDEIPALGVAADPSYWRPWARDPGYGGKWRSIRHHFGIVGFGANAYEAQAGEELVVPHEETEFGGQEELYVIIEGQARFVCDGAEIELGAGELLHVRPEVQREATALASPTVVLMIGGIPGAPYRHWTADE